MCHHCESVIPDPGGSTGPNSKPDFGRVCRFDRNRSENRSSDGADQHFKCLDASGGIAACIKARRPDANGKFTGNDPDDAAANPAFGRDANGKGKIAHPVIHPAGQHQGIDPAGFFGRDHGAAIHPNPLIGKEEGGARQFTRGHGDRALFEIGPHDVFDRVVERAEAFHQIGNRAVAIPVLIFGQIDIVIDANAGIAAKLAKKFCNRTIRIGVARCDQIRNTDCSGIDEGIARDAVLLFEQDQGIEGGAGWLAPDGFP